MKASQVLRVLLVHTTALISVACGDHQHSGIIWYDAVYQNPSKQYLDTLDLSDFPRKRLYCFLETSNLDSIEHSTFRLLSPVSFKALELVLVPKESMGLGYGKDRKRYMVATRYLEDEAVIETAIKHLKEIRIVGNVNSSTDTVSFTGRKCEMVNDLTIEHVSKVLSRGIEKPNQ